MGERERVGLISDEHLQFWYEISKRDSGHKKFHIPSVIFYFLDLTVFIINVATHASNGAYLGVGLTIFIHFLSAEIISAFYKKNENSIDENNVVFNSDESSAWKWKFLRRMCQVLAITPLFRIISNWRDHRENHEIAREQRVLRRSITTEEVQAIVLNKKRQCVKSYFDSLHAYFKTIPQCILQIYIAVDVNLPLRFCTMTDITRMTTLAWTIIAASKATASFSFALNDYWKSLEFQDYLVYGSTVTLNAPKRHRFWVSLLWNVVSVGARICQFSYILSYGGTWALVLITLVLISNIMGMKLSLSSRPAFENPPSGRVSFWSNVVDAYINVFCFHMTRLNLKTVAAQQLRFIACYGIVLVLVMYPKFDWENFEWVYVIEAVDHAYREIHSKCNFTIFSDSLNGFARVLHEILNSHEDNRSNNFKDMFNEVVLITSTILSCIVSLLYIKVYAKWAKLEYVGFPLQNSIKEWKVLLNQNWAQVETGSSFALKLVILGIADSAALEFTRYNLPNSTHDLKEMLIACVRQIQSAPAGVVGYVGLRTNVDVVINDPRCVELLNSLTQYIRGLNLGDETDRAVEYFVNNFPTFMNQMTSYRIAQIHKIVSEHNGNNGFVSNIMSSLPFCNTRA